MKKTKKTGADKKKILIIDENDQDRKVITRIFKKQGHKNITLAQTGKEGILKAQFENPDLVVLCEQLSDMCSFDVCKQIKAIERTVAKIIMITGDSCNLSASEAREAGADDYIVKTSDLEHLIQAVNFIAKIKE